MANVVLTEPHEPMALLVRRLLEREGHTVARCVDHGPLLTLLRGSPDPLVVVLASHVLPSPRHLGAGERGDVLEYLLGCASYPRRHAALVLTARADLLPGPFLALLMRAGVPVVGKPFATDALLAAVGRAAGRLRAGS
jgi:CheY-like chemotaxis protein